MISTPTRFKAVAIAVTTLVAGFAATAASAGTMASNAHDFIHRRIAENAPEARSVGEILGSYDGPGIVRGSGVLVGGRYVLTAAHLVDNMGADGEFRFNGQVYRMNRWVTASRFYSRDPQTGNPNGRSYSSGADLALVELDRHVVGARKYKATLNKSRKEVGKTATIVGFGSPGSGANGITTTTPSGNDMSSGSSAVWNFRPVKRAGYNIIEPLNSASVDPFVSNRQLVTDFDPDPNQIFDLANLNPPQFDSFTGEYILDEDDIPISQEYMPSVGDSGGGLFINGKLAGITSWTTRANSEYFSQAHYTRMSVGWWRWVEQNIAAFNRLRRDPTLVPWLRTNNPNAPGAGFRGVTRILDEDDFDEDDNEVEVLRIFGPGLFSNPDLDVSHNFTEFIVNDPFAANPGMLSETIYPASTPLPEPTSLALLSLGGLAMLRRSGR